MTIRSNEVCKIFGYDFFYRAPVKQPLEVFYKELKFCNFVKKRLQYRCFTVNIANQVISTQWKPCNFKFNSGNKKLNRRMWQPSFKKKVYVNLYLKQSGQHLSAQIQQFKTEKSVAFVPSSRCCVNSCGQNFPKITVKNSFVLKNCSLEIFNFIKNGVRCD